MKKAYTADFETTTIEPTSVWAWGIAEISEEAPIVSRGTDLEDFLLYTQFEMDNPKIYFHNLKFDGSFIIDWLLRNGYEWREDRKACTDRTFTTIISDMGQFYMIDIYFQRRGKKAKKLTLYDSLKLLNFSVKEVAKAFDLPIKKGEIDYTRHDTPQPVTQEEWEYLDNDVRIMAMALWHLQKMEFSKMTVGSCALADYKRDFGELFDTVFPKIPYEIDCKIRKAYKGGWTYANAPYAGKDVGEGVVLDVNSLYPWVMAECPLPYGEPIEFFGKYKENKKYPLYVQTIRCFFKLKPGYLPTIQLKHNLSYIGTKYLESSVNEFGEDELVTMTLASPDLEIFLKHYDVTMLEYLGGYMFKQSTELFCEWVTKWADRKIKADEEKNKPLRTLCKLSLNNLYGKFATNPIRKSKKPVFDTEKNMVKYEVVKHPVYNDDGTPQLDENGEIRESAETLIDGLYIPVGVFVTAWARYKTITTAQKIQTDSLAKTGKSRFLYSDTDSIHLSGFEEPEGVEIDPRKLGAWKLESKFCRARFIQAKRYIEDEIQEDGTTTLKVTCCGMPSSCYKYVTWENFHPGAVYAGKLNHKTVQGGTILYPLEFTLK